MPSQQTHGSYQADQPEIVIPMEVRNENVVYTASSDFVFVHLRLGAFTAIHEEKMIIQCNHLGSRVPVESRNGRIVSKYGYSEHSQVLGMINPAGNPDISRKIAQKVI
jgi:hypothetical protein